MQKASDRLLGKRASQLWRAFAAAEAYPGERQQVLGGPLQSGQLALHRDDGAFGRGRERFISEQLEVAE